ncbi:transposase [Xenorhabdus koppenhoeferi]|uniref:DDE superfamily endonuclease n=1 Tax=Xenorhabdus koppenhoeferi TaxID=351659 RepID=A0A1I7HZ42_9GAMM|nr:transposase [Xenorhabdus koppenhoeferi]SFU65917.1 DDE superfamily endonuclease [Xenorhabdus koppenhoeferi]
MLKQFILTLNQADQLVGNDETVIREYPTIDAKNVILFFGAIRETYPLSQKVHIILDRAGYHRAEIGQFFAEVLNIQ